MRIGVAIVWALVVVGAGFGIVDVVDWSIAGVLAGSVLVGVALAGVYIGWSVLTW